MPGGPPAPPQMMSRMPPDHKGVDPWGRPPRNGWGEVAPGPAGWGGEEKWGVEGPAGWGKPKTPTTPVMPGGWGEPEMDWAAKGRGPPGGLGHPKNPMYDKARLVEHGFKPEDVDPMMRNNMGLTLEDAVDQLRMGGGGPGGPGGPGGDWRAPDHPPFEPAGYSQMPPPHAPYGGVQMPPAAGAPAAGNINPAVIQQLLRQQAQGGQQSRFPGQPQPQPSPQQLRPLINQIQMAVHAGHLNPAILQQPMAPQTLLLLNHLLSQIKHLDQLSRQAHLARGHPSNSPHVHQLQMEMMRVKNNISNIQAQISSQQTMLMKQQQPPAPQPMAAGGGGPLLYKGHGGGHGGHDLHGLPANLGELSLRDGGVAGGGGHMPQSRLSQWKLPTADKLLRGDEDFSRAPGSVSKTGGSPPMTLMADSAWSASRGGRDGGWPDGGAGRGGGGPVAPAAERQESKDGWPESAGAAGGHNYADLVPEFEPGKPWKMKPTEDDPSLTPGAAARSPLGMAGGGGSSQDLIAMQTGKGSPTTSSPADSFGSSTWSFNPNGGKPGMTAAGGGGGADWGVKSRGPPPGLNKAGGGWGGGQGGGGAALSRPGAPYDQRSAFAQVQTGGYSGGGGGGSAWLLLRNLTAQIDGSTLKTLCMQHGPLYTFHMYLNQGVALVKYSSREEAAKAQGALNNCVLSNTTILAEAVSDETASQVLQQLGLPGGGQQANNPASSAASQQTAGGAQMAPKPPASAAWSDMTDSIGGSGGSSMAWSSGPAAGNSSLWAAPTGLEEPGRGPYLPDGLL